MWSIKAIHSLVCGAVGLYGPRKPTSVPTCTRMHCTQPQHSVAECVLFSLHFLCRQQNVFCFPSEYHGYFFAAQERIRLLTEGPKGTSLKYMSLQLFIQFLHCCAPPYLNSETPINMAWRCDTIYHTRNRPKAI